MKKWTEREAVQLNLQNRRRVLVLEAFQIYKVQEKFNKTHSPKDHIHMVFDLTCDVVLAICGRDKVAPLRAEQIEFHKAAIAQLKQRSK